MNAPGLYIHPLRGHSTFTIGAMSLKDEVATLGRSTATACLSTLSRRGRLDDPALPSTHPSSASKRMMLFMNLMITLSLLLNIAVLLPVCAGLMMGAGWTQAAYGGATPARGILLSIYLSIILASALLLISRDPRLVAVLLSMQIIYKWTTPFTVGTVKNPVVISNLGIAAFHVVTTLLIWQAIGNPLIGRSY